jgi:hypothetical protein
MNPCTGKSNWKHKTVETLIAFLGSNKAVIGAVVSILEGIAVLINLWSKFRSKKIGGAESMSAPPIAFKAFLWVINPVNCFRKSK